MPHRPSRPGGTGHGIVAAPGGGGQWGPALTAALDPRSAPRLARLLLGAVRATGRRTVPAWVRAAALTGQFRLAYATTAAAGRRTDALAARLVHAVLKPLLGRPARVVVAIDGTPTERYGRQGQGAGVHHNPTPGRAGQAFVYGHSWAVLAWVARPPAGGTLALPLLARLDVRRADLPGIPGPARPAFRTKLEVAGEVVRWAATWRGGLGECRGGWPTGPSPPGRP